MMRFTPIVVALTLSLRAEESLTRLKSDERIVFYPGVAQRVAGETNLWRTEIRGCVFEPEQRRLLLGALREALELENVEMTTEEEEVFNARVRLFLVDHERGKDVFVRLGTNKFLVGKSDADGRFAGEILLRDTDLERRAPPRLGDLKSHQLAEAALGVPFTAVLKSDDQRVFSGAIFPLEAEGFSIVSDIDDTIKITEVRDRKATLSNTFLRGFQAVPGMAELFQRLARATPTRPSATLSPSDGERSQSNTIGAQTSKVTFHYISASPWQLYEPLAEFVAANGFPAGAFELKAFRWKDRSFFSLFANPEQYKPAVIEPLLKQFPGRRFILIGDSGERDPEIYGALARKFPAQIERIYIRDVTNEAADSLRYQSAFQAVPRGHWEIFQEPAELEQEQLTELNHEIHQTHENPDKTGRNDKEPQP